MYFCVQMWNERLHVREGVCVIVRFHLCLILLCLRLILGFFSV